MDNNPKLEIWCNNCQNWFRSRLIQFGDSASFMDAVMHDNSEPCAKCSTTVTHDKKFMQFTDENGDIWHI
ncbi:MAG TPA: hypothetical protein VFD03_01440 [Clostridia bacterium]|nr:hypothetical protein [Clostridia bacterium]